MASRILWPRLAGLRLLRSTPRPIIAQTFFPRFAHNIPRPPRPQLPQRSAAQTATTKPTGLAPHYELTFTCVPCGQRSAHRVSKQGYHHGSVLITCPSCRNRHVISDHLQLFGGAKTVEEILQERGQLVKRGTLGEDGDVEFWDDGTSSQREARLAAEGVSPPKEKTETTDTSAPGSTFK